MALSLVTPFWLIPWGAREAGYSDGLGWLDGSAAEGL